MSMGFVPPVNRMGCIALALLLIAEFGLVLWLRGQSIREYLATRDPVSGMVHYVMLAVFAAMPLLVAREMKLAANLMSTKPHNPDYCGLAPEFWDTFASALFVWFPVTVEFWNDAPKHISVPFPADRR